MRRIALKPLDGLPGYEGAVAHAELRPGARFLVAITAPKGLTQAGRAKLFEELKAAVPPTSSVVVLPEGAAIEVFEEAPPDPPAQRPRLGAG